MLAWSIIMSHSRHCNFGHVIFRTRGVAIHPADLLRVHGYIRGIGRQLGVKSMVVGGIEDHIHILGNWPMNRAQCDIVRDIKASTSHWLSSLHSRYGKFHWQGGYAYYSVSPRFFKYSAHYIATQREHHRNETTDQELERFEAISGISSFSEDDDPHDFAPPGALPPNTPRR